MSIRDRVIMITGAGGGRGSRIARLLCENGAVAILMDNDCERGEAAAEEIRAAGGRAWYFICDVTSEADWKAAVAFTLEKGGRVDALVNNASVSVRKRVDEMTIEDWTEMMRLNTGSIFLGCKYAVPAMRAGGGGMIVNITPMGDGLTEDNGFTPLACSASSGAVTMLTEAIVNRFAGDGIRCRAICSASADVAGEVLAIIDGEGNRR